MIVQLVRKLNTAAKEEEWFMQLMFKCAALLIQERNTLEQNNLKWKVEEKKYVLPIDIAELNKYTIIEPAYLGKQSTCIDKATNEIIPIEKAKDILNCIRIQGECNNILPLLKEIEQFSTVY